MYRILFANPDRKLSEIYAQHMKDHFLVDSAHDGLSAIRKFKIHSPAIVVSDYHLPIISGLTFLKFVRMHPTHSATPFVFLSNFHDNTQALSFGANDWLSLAECEPRQLLNRLNHHLISNKHGIQIH